MFSILKFFFSEYFNKKVIEYRVAIIISAIGLFALKIGIDFLTIFFELQDIYFFNALKYGISLSLIILILVYIFSFNSKDLSKVSNLSDEFLSDVKKIFFAWVFFYAYIIISPKLNIKDTEAQNLFTAIVIDFIALNILSFGFFIYRFTWKWIKARRKRNTMKYLYATLVLILIRYLLVVFLERNGHPINISLGFVLGLIILFANQNLEWIKNTDKKFKIQVFFYSMAFSIFSLLALFAIQLNLSNLIDLLNAYFFYSSNLLNALFYISLAYFSKISFVLLFSFTANQVIDRKSSEIKSLRYFNQLTNKTIEQNEILIIGANMVSSATDADFCWIETYNGNDVSLLNSINCDSQRVEKVIASRILINTFNTSTEPFLINNLSSNNDYDTVLVHLENCRSLMAVPIIIEGERLANIIICKDEEYSFENEDLSILSIFQSSIVIALENAKLIGKVIENEKFKSELLLAREIQEKLLPQKVPDILGLDIHAVSQPAEMVGGDFYDILRLKDDSYCFLIGDVSGKGISAAFYMAQIKGVISTAAKESSSPKELAIKINSVLIEKTDKKLFTTLSIISIEKNLSKVRFVRAGHLALYLKTKENFDIIRPKGIGIGIAKNNLFEEHLEEVEFVISKDDSIYLITDGILELRDANENEFGERLLKDFIFDNCYKTSKEFNLNLVDALSNYAESMKQHDDLSVLTIKRY
jgi:serine phosphatase RsbU (regulator of sigma subunit)